MRAIIVLILLGGAARAGVDDDPDTASAWCDGVRLTYDEGAIVADGERVSVRSAAIGCRGGVTWAFLVGAWSSSRVSAIGADRGAFEDAKRDARAIITTGTCGADRDPTDVVITERGDGARCAAWLDHRVSALAGALASLHRDRRQLEDTFEFEDDVIDASVDVMPRF